MNAIDVAQPLETSRAKRLKARTTQAHERLDNRIMAGRPFESRARYGRFLAVQHQFHRDIDALYFNPVLDAVLPDLAARRRFDLIQQDLADLGLPAPAAAAAPLFGPTADIPTALGWLYVAEVSNLGAAFLLKEAAKLDLSEAFGARHLAGHPSGRGLHWRTFTAALDALEMNAAEEQRVVDGAVVAFDRVYGLAEQAFG